MASATGLQAGLNAAVVREGTKNLFRIGAYQPILDVLKGDEACVAAGGAGQAVAPPPLRAPDAAPTLSNSPGNRQHGSACSRAPAPG